MYDKGRHPIPILANGPGTGKSRFLQELPTLLEHLDEYPGLFNEKDREDLRIFNDLKIELLKPIPSFLKLKSQKANQCKLNVQIR